MNSTAQLKARLGISGTLEFHDKDGNLLKTMRMHGAIPLEGEEQIEQAKELIAEQGMNHGNSGE